MKRIQQDKRTLLQNLQANSILEAHSNLQFKKDGVLNSQGGYVGMSLNPY